MKWLGQYIQSFTARFRDDVYLEGLTTTTETDMIVVDSDGLLSKRAIDAITVDVSDFMTNGTDNYVLTATGTDAMNAEANLTFDGTDLTVGGDLQVSGGNIIGTTDGDIQIDSDENIILNVDNDSDGSNQLIKFAYRGTDYFKFNVGKGGTEIEAAVPEFTLRSTIDSAVGNSFVFTKQRIDSTTQIGEAGDDIGTIAWVGYNDGTPALKTYAYMLGEIADPVTGAEAGDLTLAVASYDGVLTHGLKLKGDTNADGEVDVDIASGAASTTTIAGTLISNYQVINSSQSECLVLNTDGNATGGPYMAFQQDGTRRSFIQHHDTDNRFRIASEFGKVEISAASTDGSDSDTSYLEIFPTGIFRFGAADNDAVLTADGNMTFRIDADNDETGQSFAFQNNASTEIANLNESGDLQIDGKLTCASRTLAVSSSTDGDHDGDVVYFGGTTSMTVGKIYHYKSDGTWEIVNADAVATSDGLLGVALGAASDTNGMLLRGMVTLDHDPGAIGDVLFVQSDNAGTPGNATATAPSASGDCVRIIGYQVSHASNGNIWFNPDSTFVEVA